MYMYIGSSQTHEKHAGLEIYCFRMYKASLSSIGIEFWILYDMKE